MTCNPNEKTLKKRERPMACNPHKVKKSRVKARARQRLKRDETTTAESRHEPDNASKETKLQQPSQGTSPTTPRERRNYNSRVKARARQRLKRDERKLKKDSTQHQHYRMPGESSDRRRSSRRWTSRACQTKGGH